MFLSAARQLLFECADAEDEVLGGQEDVALERPLALHVVLEALHALLAHPAGARQHLRITG